LSDTGLDVSVPSVFPSKAIDSVLLTADEVNTTLETYAMSGNERKGVMKVDRSTYGMTLNRYTCRDAGKIDKTRLPTLTRLRRVANAC
jgi:hypothetical protein